MLFPLHGVAEWLLPEWARKMLSERGNSERNYRSGWYSSKRDDAEFSRVIHVAFPNGVHFVVDVLDPENAEEDSEGWVELDGHHYVEATAISSAQKRAYMSGQPHRVRQVVWNL